MDDSPALNETSPVTLIGTMVIELREFNDKKNNMDKMQKLFYFITWTKFSAMFGTQIIFNMICAVKLLIIKLT